MSEWRELPKGDIVAFAEAVKAKDEILIRVGSGWDKWVGQNWSAIWSVKARSKPKTRQVQLRWFLSPDGYTSSYEDGSHFYKVAVSAKWLRIPSKDEIVEVEE